MEITNADSCIGQIPVQEKKSSVLIEEVDPKDQKKIDTQCKKLDREIQGALTKAFDKLTQRYQLSPTKEIYDQLIYVKSTLS